ncbi:hypothetical protein KIN20_013593 [Parelaphostrongylus tenuis]|uniref:Uncharacterized protein n=1 Tax=Parelaphostrongylus tenuis TaxID=148309 RepID=A0AAD5MWC2_PARTN|nr:hypothetical protein KIN20_013593 [Parelaphostrongylus tenuis]
MAAVAIITGASSGIGKATAIRFARERYALSLSGRDEKALAETSKYVRKLEQQVSVSLLVISAFFQMHRNFSRIPLSSIITFTPCGNVIDADLDLYDRQMDVNVRSVIQLTRLVLPHLIKSKGTIVNVSSITGPCPFAGVTYYCMSKAALDQFTKCLALEMAPHGVRVNSVNPGLIVTNVHRRAGMDETSYKAFLEKGKVTHALGRVGEASEVAEAILFLASGKSSFTTGELLRVDGGRGLMHPR